jgi:acetyl esterase
VTSPLPPDIAAFLAVLSNGFPPVGTQILDAATARRLLEGQRPRRDPRPVHRVDDLTAHGSAPDGAALAVPVRVYRPSAETATAGVVFLHGGGFVLCGLDSHDGLCRDIAVRCNVVVVSVDYRLAPEHPFPAGLDDAYAALGWAVERAEELGFEASRVSVAGDSAGGNLAAALAQLCRDLDGPRLRAQVLAYPMLDPAQDSASYREYAEGYFLTAAHLRWYWQCYLSGGAEVTPYVSPLRAATLEGLPPALVVLAGRDPLHDEGLAYARRLAEDADTVTLLDYPDLFHGFLGFSEQLPAVATAVDEVFGVMRPLLGGGTAG